MAMKGRIKKWNTDKGLGFIQPLEGGADVFFHASTMPDRSLLTRVNQPVTFEPGMTKTLNDRQTAGQLDHHGADDLCQVDNFRAGFEGVESSGKHGP